VRLGETYFKNTNFLHYALKKRVIKFEGEFIIAHPPELGEMLLSDKVDIAPVSSIIYGQHPEELFIMPHFSISAERETGSILLFSRHSLEELGGKAIATPTTSASSTALLQIILNERGIEADIAYGVKPELKSMLSRYDAALLIGDHALKAGYEQPHLVSTDLGKEWNQITGERMVYALWLCRKPRGSEIHSLLLSSRSYSEENFEKVVKELAGEISVPYGYLAGHLEKLNFNLDAGAMEGLEEFYSLAVEHGILSSAPELRFTEV